jgi:hypothetical protein
MCSSWQEDFLTLSRLPKIQTHDGALIYRNEPSLDLFGRNHVIQFGLHGPGRSLAAHFPDKTSRHGVFFADWDEPEEGVVICQRQIISPSSWAGQSCR